MWRASCGNIYARGRGANTVSSVMESLWQITSEHTDPVDADPKWFHEVGGTWVFKIGKSWVRNIADNVLCAECNDIDRSR